MKQNSSSPLGHISLPLVSATTSRHALVTDAAGRLVVGHRAAVHHSVPMRPLSLFTPSDSGDTVTLYAAESGHDTALWTECAGSWIHHTDIPGAVSCALAVAEGFIIAGERTMYRLSPDTGSSLWTLTDMNPAPPRISFTTVDSATLSESTGSVTLRGVTASGSLHNIPAAELQRLTTSLTDAYTRLVRTATSAGSWLQPVIVRYRLYASSHRLLYVSAPVLLAPYPMQCHQSLEAPVSIDSTVYTISSLTLLAHSWTIAMHLPDDDDFRGWLRLTDEIEVSVTPQFHPVEFAGLCSCRFARTSTSAPVAIVRMPGAEYTASRYSQIIASQLALTDSTSTVALRLRAPAAGAVMTLKCPASESPADTLKLRDKARATLAGSDDDNSLLALISPPNGFLARTVVADGDAVVWGDVTPLVRGGFSLSEMVALTSPHPWLGTVRVTLADGTVTGAAVGGTTGMPLSFGPLVCYPHGNASRIDIYIDNLQGEVNHAGFTLSPVDGAGLSAWVSPDFTPVSTVYYGDDLPEAEYPASSAPLSGTLVSATLAQPLLPLSLLRCATGQITALLPASGARSSFNSSRGRLYAFCADGVYTVTLSAHCRLLSASCVDPRHILSPGAVVATPSGVMALLSGVLCRLKGATVTSILPLPAARQLGWEPWADELWLLDSDGTLSARPLADLHSVRSVASPEPPVRLHTLPHRLLMEAERCLLEAAAPAPQSNHIIFQGEMPISSRQRLRAVEVGLAASFLTGTLTVGTHHGAGARHALPVVTLQVTGAVNAPLKAAFIAPPARYATVTIEATASSDFTLHYIHLTLA